MDSEVETNSTWLDKPISSFLPKMNVENLLAALVLVIALFSRFYILGVRVMSHDEVNHVVPSYDLYQGRGYRHDPVTHGPMQFHLVALSYFLLGDNDFSSRVPAALFSVAAVGVVLFGFRRYLGRAGALIGGLMFVISPYLLFYGRYTRNEGFIELFAVLIFMGILRYLEKGQRSTLYLLAVVTALNFATKETAYIYTAQYLLFVGVLFLEGVLRLPWQDPMARRRFSLLMVLAIALVGIALGLAVWSAEVNGAPVDAASPAPAAPAEPAKPVSPMVYGAVGTVVVAVALVLLAIVLLVKNLGWAAIRSLRSFDLLILIGTLILPQLTAFPVKMVGWDPLDYQMGGMLRTGIFLISLFVVSVLIGLWWNPRIWLASAAAFYAIFTVLYTTFFTNGQGFFTGIIGSLGYWLSQQGVQRGSQPWYYYGLVQIPIYEFLAALGTLLAVYFAVRYRRFWNAPGDSPARVPDDVLLDEATAPAEQGSKLPVLALFVYWSLTALVAYSIAGEKMPWLTVHIALPTVLAGAWGLGYLVDTTPWKKVTGTKGLLAVLLAPVLLAAVAEITGALLGANPPFQGKTLEQLASTNQFVLAVVLAAFSAGGIVALLKDWRFSEMIRLGAVVFFAVLALLTARTAYRASFINYDYATEYLVYAHAAPGPKQVLSQVEEISRRITGGKDIKVAYDSDGLYPYWWYFRDYPNHRFFQDKPTRDLHDYPLIIASDTLSGKLEPIVRDDYYKFDYTRLWWPNQDYFNLTWERIGKAIADPKMRAALFDIWLNRDYRLYAEITGSTTLKVETWQPASRMRFYVRKDIFAQMWNLGAAPAAAAPQVEKDPYEGKIITLAPDLVIGSNGKGNAQFQSPRGVAAAPDGTVYVADSGNHRIQHISADGQFMQSWGNFADASKGAAPGGTFNEPWGIAVGPDGSVYVADTWNHRVQKFTADGKFISMWGYFGQAEQPQAFWGPRGIAVDRQGRVYVTDTGNKRVVIFDANGSYLSQFGTAGLGVGEFDEPVGLAVDATGKVYVADTWNQRIQAFSSPEGMLAYQPERQWEIYGWFGQSLDNKPYLAVDRNGNVFASDPEGYRVLEFDQEGNFVRGWNGIGGDPDAFSMPVGLSVDPQGRVWLVDSGNHYLIRFTLPAAP